MRKILILATLLCSAAAAGEEVPGLCRNPKGQLESCQPQSALYPNNPRGLLPSIRGLGVRPPEQYDRLYPADRLFHITAAADEMAALCPGIKTAFRITLGCTYPPGSRVPAILKERQGDADCVIVSPDLALLNATGWGNYGKVFSDTRWRTAGAGQPVIRGCDRSVTSSSDCAVRDEEVEPFYDKSDHFTGSSTNTTQPRS